MNKNMEKIIGPYKKPKASFHSYDSNAPLVAAILKNRVEKCMSDVVVEHVGSTAVPDCPGKGVVDLMALYPESKLESVKALLQDMGFQRQGQEFKNRFPDERPVFMGTFPYEGNSYLVYVHVIQQDSYEAVRFRIFRDRLIKDSELRSEYIAVKKQIIASGVVDTDEYAVMKRDIIQKILGDDYEERRHS